MAGPRPFFCLGMGIFMRNQTKECNSANGRSHSEWPTVVREVILFTGVPPGKIIAQFLDYAIFSVLQFTHISEAPLIVTDLVVNGEFHPTLAVPNISGQFSPLRLPLRMRRGSSFGAVLQAPAVNDLGRGCCYRKLPVSMVLSTDHGDFAFMAVQVIRRDDDGPVV